MGVNTLRDLTIEAPSSRHYPLPLPRLAAAEPDRLALSWQGESISRGALSAAADDAAGRLAGIGVGAGDRVASLLPDIPEVAALVHGLARIGAVHVPLGARSTAEELKWPIENTEPRVIICDPDLGDRLTSLGSVRQVSVRSGSLIASASGNAPRPMPILDLDPPAADVELLDVVPLDAAQAIIHTSGTTGRPKGAVLTWENQVWSAMGSGLRLGVQADDLWLAPLPLHHVGGLAILLRSALYGTAAALPGRIDAHGLAEAFEREPITMVSLVPTQLARLLDVRGAAPAPESLRVVLVGGGPASPALLERANALGYPIVPTYGLSEAASQVATCAPGWSPVAGEPPAAPPLPSCELQVVGEDGRVLEAGEVGGIEVKGPIVMPGYWRDQLATQRAIHDGWLRTGDLGSLDVEGRLVMRSRRDDLIVTGGENVYPAEVEGVLDGHSDVAASCVLGVPDAEWGQIVVAVIEPVGQVDPDLASLEAFVRQRLAGYKVPRRFVIIDEMKRTASGKVRRGVVRQFLEKEYGRRFE